MKKKALKKEFYMEIRRSLGRFLSIFFIVAIGVSFFSGIRAAEPDMRYSGDAYFDEKNLMDIQVMSTLGLTDEDIKVLKQVDGIENVEAGYSTDALCAGTESQAVLHIMSMLPSMNELTLEEGRLPEKPDECAVDADLLAKDGFLARNGYQIGDTIRLTSGTDAPITDTLTGDTFTIVGSVSSPNFYFLFGRGNTTIGTGSVSGFAAVLPESFRDGCVYRVVRDGGRSKRIDRILQTNIPIMWNRCSMNWKKERKNGRIPERKRSARKRRRNLQTESRNSPMQKRRHRQNLPMRNNRSMTDGSS